MKKKEGKDEKPGEQNNGEEKTNAIRRRRAARRKRTRTRKDEHKNTHDRTQGEVWAERLWRRLLRREEVVGVAVLGELACVRGAHAMILTPRVSAPFE